MLWIKAFHIIAVIAWFTGLFYLPRLFVYHAESQDKVSRERFKIMEKKLFFYIMTPVAILATLSGLWLLLLNHAYYRTQNWMHLKIALVALLWVYHLYCGRFLRQFRLNQNKKSSKFYRIFNEVPALLLIGIVVSVTVRPF